MLRLFVACDLPGDVRDALLGVQTDLPGARWTPAAQVHLTLRFLGGTPEDRVPALEAALAGCRAPALHLRLGGLTVFPGWRRPRVLVALVDPDPRLAGLQGRIEEIAREIGYEPETRPFTPHVTLARFKRADPLQVHRFVRARPDLDLGFRVTDFHLYQSTLRPAGAVHEKRATFALGR